MISDELNVIIKDFRERGKMDFFDGVTDTQISEFEKKNLIEFPSQFREWLEFSDGGECFLPAGVQFYGIAHKPIIDPHDESRPDDKYFVIGTLSNGDPVLCKQNEEKISIYNQEAGKIADDEIYENFHTFLKDLPDLLGIEG